ncbi:23S rRNA (adenine(1618)-N(6))-methyltransferase RlmF [Lewinella sp. IMCC34183]|uniref:23S rRNA (adenine(1618)-N(6))-methyltransferase RlmF n=1 Tax=Lewinella sp. IMCC34183 TaxID=2248762 RepID=UPI000E272FD6|nr:23S rRNA (adenine(1618)-N(6))-methyltransferase RlmF [Lewinella sp. IMCC34183]
MHPRNRYRSPHDFPALCRIVPALEAYLIQTPDGRTSLDFSRREALLHLNRALLLRDYGLRHWDLPDGHLVPPLPGRLDYVHAVADLVPDACRILDIGTGASLIYPILGVREYGWEVVGSEIHPHSLRVARAIVTANLVLRGRIEVREQPQPEHVFAGVVRAGERFSATLCNPPFFPSREAAVRAGQKKWSKLGRQDAGLSFGGADTELWTPGGEVQFLRQLIGESRAVGEQVGWFTTLVSKKGYLETARHQLERLEAVEIRVVPLEQGNKKSRMLAWTYRR